MEEKDLEKKSDGLAIASLVLGIVSLVIPCLLLPGSIIGLIFGLISKSKTGIKKAGIILNTIAFILFIIALIIVLMLPNIVKRIDTEWNDLTTEERNNTKDNWTNIESGEKKSNSINKSTDLKKKEDGRVVIYFFRGEGCPHCAEAEEWFDSIQNEYGNMFKVEDYETWYDEENADFMERVAKSRGETASGVPYIIIGDKSWMGFTESYENEMLEEIKTVYND